MPINADKPHLWKADIADSIVFHNDWLVRDAQRAYRDARDKAATEVEMALAATANLTDVTPAALRRNPGMLPLLRMAATPTLSRERLVALAGASVSLVTTMERDGQVPPQLIDDVVDGELARIGEVLMRLADRDIFPWLEQGYHLTGTQIHRAATIVADRMCAAGADAIVREAQHTRQIEGVTRWLQGHGYARVEPAQRLGLEQTPPGTFAQGLHVPVLRAARHGQGIVAIDLAVMPAHVRPGDLPVLVDAQSLGDAARAARMRGEAVAKLAELRGTYGKGLRFVVVICGYVDSAYLGSVAAEGIDWVWEHRLDDLAQLDPGTARLGAEAASAGSLAAVATTAGRHW